MICSYCHSEIDDEAVYCPHCCTPVEGAQECEDFVYEAFISYRHLPKDREVAVTLQKAIEGFSIPKHLRTSDGPKRLGKLFRDEDELPTSSSLPDQIRDALVHSRYLFVVCSPKTNESQWVAREVELFASFHGRDKIRIVLAEAEPDDSFPTLLRTRLAKSSSGEIVSVEEEPLAADFRDLSRKHVNVEKLRLIAPLLGCGFDDLRQRMKARRTRIAATAAAVVTTVSVAFGSFSTYQQFQIQENYRQMQINESEALAVEANTLFEQGDRMQAIQVALAALPESEAVQSRPYVPAAQLALETALEVYPSGEYWRSCYSLPYDEFTNAVTSEDGYIATTGDDRTLVVCDLATGVEVCTIDVEKDMGFAATTSLPVGFAVFAGDSLICTRDDAIACFDANTGEMRWIENFDDFDGAYHVAVSESGKELAFVTQPYGFGENDLKGDRYKLYVLDVATGAVLKQGVLPEAGNAKEYQYSISSATCFVDDDTVAVAGGKALFVVDLATGECSVSDVAYGCVDSIDYLGGQLYVVSRDNPYIQNGPFAVEAYDIEGKQLWSYERDIEEMSTSGFTAHGEILIGHVAVCGIWQPEGVERPYALVLFGSHMLLLDAQDGSTFWSESRESTLAACAVSDSGAVIVAFTDSGDIMWRRPDRSNTAGSIYDRNIGQASNASFVCCEGTIYFCASNSYGSGQRVYRFAEKISASGIEPLEGFEDVSSVAWGQVLIAKTQDSFIVFDSTTLEPRFEIKRSSLPLLLDMPYGVDMYCAPSGRIYLYGYLVDAQGEKDYKTMAVNVYSADDGSVVASYAVEMGPETGSWSDSQLSEVVDKSGAVTGVVLLGTHEVRVVDPLTGETLSSHIRKGSVSEVWVTDTMAILNESADDDDADESKTSGVNSRPHKFSLVNLETGETIDCDLSNAYVGGATSHYRAIACLSEDGTKFVAACSVGGVQMFDTKTGKVIWKSEEAPSLVSFLAISSTSGDVLLQDSTGVCMLLSGKDGSILRTSSTALPPIEGSYGMINDKEIMVRWCYSGLANDIGLAIISLDEEAFGPRSSIPGGFFLTPDGSTILLLDASSSSRPYMKMHLYSLDELIALAHEVTAGHELNASEKHLYRID